MNVKDVLGAPVPGADVRINTYWSDEDKRIFADADGRAVVTGVIASKVSIAASGPDCYSGSIGKTVSADGVLTVDIVAQPTADGTGGIARAWVSDGGLSADGRTLEFSLQIVQVPPDVEVSFWRWDPGAVRVLACTPDPGNDLPRHHADCVSGADGFDAPYEGVNDGLAVSTSYIEAPGPYTYATPYSAALLLDQSAHVVVDDPADSRLFAAKYFLTRASSNDPKLLAAFASDDPVTARLSPLPQKPVSVFPLENPQYSESGRSYFPTVDDLGTLEGGSTPLFAAIDRMLDFAAVNGKGATNALVVVTNGRDDTCGSPIDCQKLRDDVIEKSKATGVAIVTIGLEDAGGNTDRETLALLAQGAPHGAVFWAQNPKQLAPILGNVDIFLSDFMDSLQATFRIQSPVAGAFASGRKVLGSVRLEVCPFDCYYTFVPFVVEIP